jgi:PAS domain S-box-containing protein
MTGGDRGTVLIVEDDEATAELERRSLARSGTTAVIVSGVKDALQLLEERRFTAILLDYQLPGGDPWAVVNAANSKHPRIPVVVVTGQGSEHVVAEALHRGVSDYVKKIGAFWEELPAILIRVTMTVTAEERLRESEERFRGAFEFAAIGMALVAPDGRFLRVNRSLCRIVGYTAEDLMATDFQTITHPDDLETDVDFVRQMIDGLLSHYDMEKRYFHRDGHVIWILLSVSLVRDAAGAPLYFVSQMQDVTQQRRLTIDLRIAREDLQAILDNVPARITSWHADSTNHFVNQVAAAQLGVPAGEAVGKHLQEILGPERYAKAKPYLDAAFNGERQWYEEVEAQPDGTLRYQHVEFVPKRSDGKVAGLYALATDVTPLRESYRRVRELAQRLETVREDERRSIAQVLHEGLAQDLFAMSLMLSHLRSRSASEAHVIQACQELICAVDKCIVGARQIAYELRPSALAHLPVSVALKEHAWHFEEISGLIIRVAETVPIPTVDEATALILFRAAQEALTNVVRHARASSVDIVLRADGNSIAMDVIDDGVGIEEAALGKSGSLGLLGIRERASARGGALVVQRNVGVGTTISVRLPIVDPSG